MTEVHTGDLAAEFNVGDARYREARRVTLVGAAVNLVLSGVKILVGWLGHSQSLVADGIHSLSDLATDVLVLWAAKHGSRDADAEHPYGHGRIETLATVVLGIFLLAVGAGIGIDASRRLFHTELLLTPGWLALGAAAASVLLKEALYHYTLRAARRLRSNMLRANAWHHRTDSISSVVVIVGIAGTMAGLPYLDAIAAVGVALMIVKIGWDLAWHSVHELIDTALEQERVEHIREKILSVDGVRAVHQLRTRRHGGQALVDVHLQVDPRLSVSEGHRIGERVLERLHAEVEEVSDVVVHVDPEDDESSRPSSNLPLRGPVLERLRQHWKAIEGAEQVRHVTLHYLDGAIHVEAWVPLDGLVDLEAGRQLSRRLAETAAGDPDVAEVKVLYY